MNFHKPELCLKSTEKRYYIFSIFKDQLIQDIVLIVCGSSKPCYYADIVLVFIYVAPGILKNTSTYITPWCRLVSVGLCPSQPNLLGYLLFSLLIFTNLSLEKAEAWGFKNSGHDPRSLTVHGLSGISHLGNEYSFKLPSLSHYQDIDSPAHRGTSTPP